MPCGCGSVSVGKTTVAPANPDISIPNDLLSVSRVNVNAQARRGHVGQGMLHAMFQWISLGGATASPSN